MVALYGALVRLGWLLVLPYQSVTAWIRGRPSLPLRERLGHPPAAPGGAATPPGGLWVHAVSVGEVRLALSLIRAWRERAPGRPITLTTGTPSGRELAAGAPAASRPDGLAALPFDLPGPLGRFLDRLRPSAVVIVETEIWPNLLRLCGRRGIPVLLVNGRISPRAFPRYRLLRPLLARVLPAVGLFAVQSEDEARRLRALGAPPDRVRVTGNLKFDLPEPRAADGEVRRRLGLDGAPPLFVAGSTSGGEEAAAAAALAELRRVDSRARLVVAPRHPERFAEAERALRAAALRVVRWSALGSAPPPAAESWDAVLLDAMGVLPEVYAAADLVFVGGSLVRRGGQNLLEPAALGRPVLFGPHVENFAAAARALVEAGGGFPVRDAADLGRTAARLLADPAGRRVAGTMARRVVEANRGALRRTLDLMEAALRDPAPVDRAAAAGR
jgi:3-deoxy-D-manno-octulosonic-acid transferase